MYFANRTDMMGCLSSVRIRKMTMMVRWNEMQDEREEEESRKRRSMRKLWGDGVPAFTVEQKHLEAFLSTLTENVVQAQQLHHSQFHTFPAPQHTRMAENFTAREKTNKPT